MSTSRTSRIEGFYRLPLEERVRIIAEWADLTEEEVKALLNFGNLL